MTFLVPPDRFPVSAIYLSSVGTLVVTYAGPLIAGVVAPANWSRRDKGRLYFPTTAIVTGSQVDLTGWFYVMDSPGPDVCGYGASPADVIDLGSGQPVAPFADYPVSAA